MAWIEYWYKCTSGETPGTIVRVMKTPGIDIETKHGGGGWWLVM